MTKKFTIMIKRLQFKSAIPALMFGFIAQASVASTTVTVVKASDNSEVSYEVQESGKLYFDSNENLVINADGTATTATYAVSAIRKVLFTNNDETQTQTSLAESNINVYADGDNLYVINAPETARVEVYAITGVKMLDQNISSSSSTISISSLPAGIYVVRVNGSTFKISRS